MKGVSTIVVEYNKLLGNYNTTFFSIHLYDDDISTYAHEYIHHIQNITTPYGLTYYASRLIYLMHEIIKNPRSALYAFINELWEKNKVEILQVIKQVGETTNFDYNGEKVEDIVFKYKENTLCGQPIKVIESVNVKIKIQDEIVSIPFTVRMIKENMARLIQNRCFPKSFVCKNITYRLVEEIVEWYAPYFPVKEQTIVALCDLSLMADNPLQGFFELLKYFKKVNSNKINSKFMFECIENEKIFTLQGFFYISEILERQLDICYNAIDSFYISFDCKAEIGEWIKELCCKGINYRKRFFSFLCDIMDENISTSEAQNIFFGIIKEIGFAIEFDSKNNFIIPRSLKPEDFVQLIALEEYTLKKIDELNGLSSPCRLKKFCESYVRNKSISAGDSIRSLKAVSLQNFKKMDIDLKNSSVVNDSCIEPLKRNINEKLCPFTYICRNINAMNGI